MKTTFELSDREIEIMQFAYRNANAKQISEALFIAEGTVYSHFKRIYRKVDVHSKKRAHRHGERVQATLNSCAIPMCIIFRKIICMIICILVC